MAADSIDTLVEIGVIGRPHGVVGEVRIFLHSPGSTILESFRSVLIVTGEDTREYQLRSVRQGNKCLLAKLSDVANRDQAEALKGARICVYREALPPIEADEFYVADLIGLEAWEGDTMLGTISSSRPQGGIEVVTVRGDDEELEIPLVEDFVVEIDMERGRIRVFDTKMLPRSPAQRRGS